MRENATKARVFMREMRECLCVDKSQFSQGFVDNSSG